MILKIATSQFPISADIIKNKDYILKQMREASQEGCDVIHLPEGSLSGYAGVDFESFKDFDWATLLQSTKEIMAEAKSLALWVILGSSHRLSGNNKPHNSLYIINDRGDIEDRYDKLFCAGDDTGTVGDLAHYSSGNHFTTFEIKGVKCGVLICHDYRYPELYRELKKRHVEVVFHSYHAGNMDSERQRFMESQIGEAYFHLNPGRTYPEITMPATMISYAANNYVWISCSNTSAQESCWGSFIVRADGVIVGRQEKNCEGILLTEFDTQQSYYDSTQFWRERAINGNYFSGEKIDDERSSQRHLL
ncbi:carbon-nitrogen hydrolase family protein [Limibacter armeniacum]|uniref:carbon-nitrogen hydrolase family protein n=1 Tax=Limibacter armeniacum TaxID=466084 RepID=UPI002FE5F79D